MNSFLKKAADRYSVRAYRPDAVEPEKIDRILEAARLAPTACNNQPQRIFVLQSEQARKTLAEVCPCTFGAPVIFAVGYDRTREAKNRMRPDGGGYGVTDAAIVCTHMMMEATELGLGSCWVGWFHDEQVQDVLNLPEEVVICDLLTVGYAAENAKPSNRHTQSRELAEMVAYL